MYDCTTSTIVHQSHPPQHLSRTLLEKISANPGTIQQTCSINKAMHPPLDRPHPDCQDEIEALRHCHETRSTFKIWACNEIKHKLDLCFKAEKAKLLKVINKDMHERRKQEDEAYADAAGHQLSFEEYLKQDPLENMAIPALGLADAALTQQ